MKQLTEKCLKLNRSLNKIVLKPEIGVHTKEKCLTLKQQSVTTDILNHSHDVDVNIIQCLRI